MKNYLKVFCLSLICASSLWASDTEEESRFSKSPLKITSSNLDLSLLSDEQDDISFNREMNMLFTRPESPKLTRSDYLEKKYPNGCANRIDGFDYSRGEGLPYTISNSKSDLKN